MSGGASSLLRSTTQCTFLSILLVVLATLLACISVPPLPVKPQLHSGEPPDIPHHLIERRPRLAPGSYLTDTRTRFANLSPPPREGAVTGKNTVAVVLNWSRFQNVRRIVSLLCGSELDSIMRHVLVWNNSPEPRTYQVRDSIHHRLVTVSFPTPLQGLHSDLLFGREVRDHQLDGEHVFLCTILRMLAVRCRVLFCSSSDFTSMFDLHLSGVPGRRLSGSSGSYPDPPHTCHRARTARCCASTSPSRTLIQRPPGGAWTQLE